MSKPTGLAAFTRKGTPAPAEPAPVAAAAGGAEGTSRKRGKGELVALTVRLPRAEWERVHQLAVSEGVSIQALAVQGLSSVFTDKGLPGLGS